MASYEAESARTPHIRVEVLREDEGPDGWTYEIDAAQDADSRLLELRLGFRDHDHWSGGASRPSVVAKAVVRVLIERLGLDELPGSFDAARGRRLVPDFDELVGPAIEDGPTNG